MTSRLPSTRRFLIVSNLKALVRLTVYTSRIIYTVKNKPATLCKGLVQMGFRLSAVDEKLSYRSVIGKLNFLEKSSRPDLAYSVHT